MLKQRIFNCTDIIISKPTVFHENDETNEFRTMTITVRTEHGNELETTVFYDSDIINITLEQ